MHSHLPPSGHVQGYAYGRTLDAPFAAGLERLRAALLAADFTILYEADVGSHLQETLGVAFGAYTILGVSSPLVTHRALLEDRDVGLLLPCNVVVYEEPQGQCTVKAIDAMQLLSITGQASLETLAAEVTERLRKVIDEL